MRNSLREENTMDNRKLIDNPNRYIKEPQYFDGYVCFIDILGFSQYVLSHPYFDLRDLFNRNLNLAINHDANFDEIKFCFLSDSVVITVQKNEIKYPDAEIKSLISLCCSFRELIFSKTKLEIRASLTYGEYMHSGPSNVAIFGPAIIRAYKLTEKLDRIKSFEIPRIIKLGRPASIIVDKNVFQSDPNNILISDYIDNHIVLKTGYVLINPFLESSFLDRSIEKRCREYLEFLNTCSKKHKCKYKNTKKLASIALNNTPSNKRRLFGKKVCITIEDEAVLHKNIFGPR